MLMPKLSPVAGSENWVLLEDWKYTSLKGEKYSVPAGFVTDLDSVPRIPFVYALYKGKIRAAAVLHDWLYKNGYARDKSDLLMLEVGERLDKVPNKTLVNIYNGVRAFGWLKYKAKNNEKVVILDGDISGVIDINKKAMKWSVPASAAPYLDAISAATLKYSLPENLLARLLYQESRFRDDIINGQTTSNAGAVGIAQIVPRWHPNVDPLDPFASIEYAADYLASLKNQFGDWATALAAYNWGMGNVSNAQSSYGADWFAHAPAETQNYVNQITADVAV